MVKCGIICSKSHGRPVHKFWCPPLTVYCFPKQSLLFFSHTVFLILTLFISSPLILYLRDSTGVLYWRTIAYVHFKLIKNNKRNYRYHVLIWYSFLLKPNCLLNINQISKKSSIPKYVCPKWNVNLWRNWFEGSHYKVCFKFT